MDLYKAKTITLDNGEYVPVHERIKEFYSKYPDGSIQTTVLTTLENVKEGSLIVVKCYVFRSPTDEKPVVGHSQTLHGLDHFKTSALEIAETSAVGRALGNLCIGVKGVFASADEVEKSKMQQAAQKQTPKSTSDVQKQIDNIDTLDAVTGELVKKIYVSKTIEELKECAEQIKKSAVDDNSKSILRKAYNQKNKELKAQKDK
jgi:hypothetical protein